VSLGGIATYVAILGLLFLWIAPWAILCLILSGFADLDARESLLIGLLLGPLSCLLLFFLILNKKKPDLSYESGLNIENFYNERTDPFA